MRPCISEATTMPASFMDDVNTFADAGWQAMEVWLTKIEQHLRQQSAAETRKRVADRGLILAAASYQGGLLLSEGEGRKAHYDHFKRRLDLCQFFGIPTMLLASDFATNVERDHLPRAV